MPVPVLARVPHAPPALLGLAAFRGEPVPVLSLASLLGRPEGPIGKIILIDVDGPVGLAVTGVTRINQTAETSTIPTLDMAGLIAAAMPQRRSPRGLHPRTHRASAEAIEVGTRQAETLPLVTFLVAGQEFALPIAAVEDVLRLPTRAAPVPNGEAAIIGNIAWRGSTLPLLSLGVLLGLPKGVATHQARIVVTRIAGHTIGLVVDALRNVERATEESIDPVSPLLNRGSEARVQAICRLEGGERLVSILSPDQLVKDDLKAAMPHSRSRGPDVMTASAEEELFETFLFFGIEGARYAVPIEAVLRVSLLPPNLTSMPRAPEFVKGLMQIDGDIVPVIDQPQRFHGRSAASQKPRVVVLTIGALTAGFIVDTVEGIRRLPIAALREAPDLGVEGLRVFERVAQADGDESLILIVSPQQLFEAAERDLLLELSREALKSAP